jgi:hypothetical protein
MIDCITRVVLSFHPPPLHSFFKNFFNTAFKSRLRRTRRKGSYGSRGISYPAVRGPSGTAGARSAPGSIARPGSPTPSTGSRSPPPLLPLECRLQQGGVVPAGSL